MKKIIVHSKKHGNKTAFIDNEDFTLVSKFKWSVSVCPNNKNKFYTQSRIKGQGKTISIHRLVMKAKKGETVDHIDGNPLNNTRSNLRLCSQSNNSKNQNLRVTNTTGFKGVSKHKYRKKYSVTITVNYKCISGGYFKRKIDAAKRYNELALQYHGEFAKLNPIPS